MYPADCKYTKDHEWLKPLADGTALVGITSYAAEALGDVVFVQLPESGSAFSHGDEFGTVESVKTVSELFMPVDAEVVEINGELDAHPEFVNEDPFGKGWMVKVRVKGELPSDLMNDAAYSAHVSAEAH
jgi:glycine cleavage system H protein